MSKPKLQNMNVDQLVSQFATVALQQDDASLAGDIHQVNKLFDRLEAIEGELKSGEIKGRH